MKYLQYSTAYCSLYLNNIQYENKPLFTETTVAAMTGSDDRKLLLLIIINCGLEVFYM